MKPPQLPYSATVPAILRRGVLEFGDADLLVTEGARLTYRDLDARSSLLARRMLALGVGKGTRIGLHFPTGDQWLVAWAAVARIGAIAILIPSTSAAREVRQAIVVADVDTLVTTTTLLGRDNEAFLEDAIPELVRTTPPFRMRSLPYLRRVVTAQDSGSEWAIASAFANEFDGEEVDETILTSAESEVAPSDDLVVVFTSGSTASPKAVVHNHGAVVRRASQTGLVEAGQRIYCGMQFFWIGGLLLVAAAMQKGATIVCQERFEATRALELLERERVTAMVAWGTTQQALRADPSFASRRLLVDIVEAHPAQARFRHGSLGMTETMGPHSGGARRDAPLEERTTPLPQRLWGSWGAPLEGFEHQIVDPATGTPLGPGQEGEICVRGYSLMSGFYKRERWETFDEDGWYHTGDLGYRKDGYLFFEARRSDMIKSHGANISPKEVEQALLELPEVDQAFVFGIPDEERGQIVGAAIVTAQGRSANIEDIRGAIAGHLSSFKIPRQVLWVEPQEVPILPSGKPDVGELRRRIEVLASRGASDASHTEAEQLNRKQR